MENLIVVLAEEYSLEEKIIGEIVFFITKYQDHYLIQVIYKFLRVNQSTYYKYLHHKESNWDSENKKINEDI